MNLLEKILKFKHGSQKSGATGATLLQNPITTENNYKKAKTAAATKVLQTATDYELCPAMGKWASKGSGYFCFYRSYFEGKPGPAIPLDEAIRACPKLNRSEK